MDYDYGVVISTNGCGLKILEDFKGHTLSEVKPSNESGEFETRLLFERPAENVDSRKSFFTEEEESELIEAIQEYAESDEIRHFDEVAKSIVMRLAANAIGYWRESQ